MRANLRLSLLGLVAAALLLAPALSAAQTPAPVTGEHDFSHCSIVGILSGAQLAPSEAGPVLGGLVGWPLTNHLGLELAAGWSDRSNDGSAFQAGMTLRRNLGAREGVMPYLKAGAGVHVATVDTGRGTPPEFYRRRLGPGDGPIAGSRHTFVDPAVVLGSGISWFIGRKFAVRPEVEAFIVRGDSRTTVVTSVVARFEYHFEPMRITR
jgi:hypothetical protein